MTADEARELIRELPPWRTKARNSGNDDLREALTFLQQTISEGWDGDITNINMLPPKIVDALFDIREAGGERILGLRAFFEMEGSPWN